MIEFNMLRLFHVIEYLLPMESYEFISRLLKALNRAGGKVPEGQNTVLNSLVRDFPSNIASAVSDLRLAGMYASASALERIVTRYVSRPDDANKEWTGDLRGLTNLVENFRNCLSDELESKVFLTIIPARVIYYKSDVPLFGQRVYGAFPLSRYDLEEAGKCFALGRSTACVFHLMRAVEGALSVLSEKLNATVTGVNGEKLTWGVLLSNVKFKIDSLQNSAEKDAWLGVHAMLHSVNRSFRTKTAHPERNYTDEQAENALNSVRAFLQEMAPLA